MPQYSVRTLLIAFTIVAIGICNWPQRSESPPDSDWRSFCDTPIPLQNIPHVSVVLVDATAIQIELSNHGSTTLQFVSDVPGKISRYVEFEIDDEWQASDYPWCPIGQQLYEIRPNESVQIATSFSNTHHRERVLAQFLEKHTQRSGMVVIATEAEKAQ